MAYIDVLFTVFVFTSRDNTNIMLLVVYVNHIKNISHILTDRVKYGIYLIVYCFIYKTNIYFIKRLQQQPRLRLDYQPER
jgi:amino acid transporter